MEITDLMIGNYVNYLGHTYIIEEISAKGWVHLIHPETKIRLNLTSDYIMHLLEPVPFTPEILELNGFDKCATGLYTYVKHELNINVFFLPNTKEGESKIVVNINSLCLRKDGSNLLHTYDINYVHQFQHALKLLGLNNLANTFKVKNNHGYV